VELFEAMSDVVLTTLNAKYIHSAFGLRYLLANLGELRGRARILEFDIGQRSVDVAEQILAQSPRIVGIGIYIWNVAAATKVVATLKHVRPDLVIVLGGPEVSYGPEDREIIRDADYVVTGEADLAFAELCRGLLSGERPAEKIIRPVPPDLDRLALPYDLYDDEDVGRRVIYVEASRGCPFGCEFCLSSIEVPVRRAPLPEFLAAMQRLLDRGVQNFKFVDRTFNLSPKTSGTILQFFAERHRTGLHVHFEMVPDRLPGALRETIRRFPPGALQFEVGIQTFNERVAELISRRQNNTLAEDNLRFLRGQTGVHIHADLIVGLPGEDLASLAAGFDRLVALQPHEIQVGILKRLHGTPIVRHDDEWGMVYDAHPPYEILQTKLIDFETMQRLRRFARYWDLVANSGNFIESTPLIWTDGSPFRQFLDFSDWLYARFRQTHAIALRRLCAALYEYLTTRFAMPGPQTAAVIGRDYERGGRTDCPSFTPPKPAAQRPTRKARLPRQSRHWS
jgi:radical SAM superfamily enzyme YgiQ (UPF0313 family)